MKKNFILILILLPFFVIPYSGKAGGGLIPRPTTRVMNDGHFEFDQNTRIYATPEFEQELRFLQKELLRYKALPLSVARNEAGARIILSHKLPPGDGSLYYLKVSPDQVDILANSNEGIFYGIISFLQLVNSAQKENGKWMIPCLMIGDRPQYEWRGIMLDESRHFFGKEKVKSILDWMAYYKLNKFHWHLTDAPGWRVEIMGYPKLGLVGGIGNHTQPNAPATFYSQEDIKEIVAYARERKIEIIPEIDMPGHATAANRAYPEFSGGGSDRYPDFTFHPGKEGTYGYLTDILREIDGLFPSQMIHIGGDEVSFGNEKWSTDPLVLSLMEKENLEDLKAVEDYFIRRMADSLLWLNNQVLAWDEMAGAGLPEDQSILFWWRHDKPGQLELSLKNGHKTVICPRLPFYFDFVQHEDHRYGRKWGGRFNELQDVYDFSTEGIPVEEEQKPLILGFQGNLWTETINNNERLDYLLFPRIAALSETVWTMPEKKDYERFLEALKVHIPLYEEARLYYYDPFDPGEHPEPALIE